MNLTRASATLGLLALAGLVRPLAGRADDAGWYLGGNVGWSDAQIDDVRIVNRLLSSGYTTTSIHNNGSDLGYKIFGGYQFNRNFALEGGYFDLGEFGFTATTMPQGTLNGNIKLKGLNFGLVGMLPITKRVSAFVRGGVNYAEAKDSFVGSGAIHVLNPKLNKRAANYKFGLGLQYDFTKWLALRAEAERYRVDDAVGNNGDVDLFSTGLVYRFFGTAQPATAREVLQKPVATVAEAPLMAVMPPPVPRRKLVFSAGSLFDFKQAIVTPMGKQALDKFAAELKGVEFTAILVTGHADRIGAHHRNMALSARRAEAVKDYLVESAGIPASKILTWGVDGAEPVTKPGDCQGSKPTSQLIACLQPDRRVEVEVTGSK